MDELGRREWVGLGVLVIAFLIALSFFDPAAGRPSVQRPISHGQPVVQESEHPSLTPVRARDLPAPEAWTVRYMAGEPGIGTEFATDSTPTLDIETESAPFEGITDDNWYLYAEASWDLPAGRYAFTLERNCEVVVFIDGAEVRREADSDVRNFLRVTFEHDGGPVTVGITAMDRRGSFVLRWATK